MPLRCPATRVYPRHLTSARPRRDLALQVPLLNDVVEALASRFLSRFGRKIPKSLTDFFRIWHGAPQLMIRSPVIFATRVCRQRNRGPLGLTIPLTMPALVDEVMERVLQSVFVPCCICSRQELAVLNGSVILGAAIQVPLVILASASRASVTSSCRVRRKGPSSAVFGSKEATRCSSATARSSRNSPSYHTTTSSAYVPIGYSEAGFALMSWSNAKRCSRICGVSGEGCQIDR